MRLASVLWPLVVCAAAVAGPSSPGPPRVSEILRDLRLMSEPAAAVAEYAGALDAILGHRAYPGSCATPLVLALQRSRPDLPPWSRGLVERLGPESARPDDQVLLSPAFPSPGSFRIRYTTMAERPGALRTEDGDLDGVPDEARRILALLLEARTSVLEAFEQSGTPIARADASEAVHDVDVSDLPEGIAGWVWSGPSGPVLLLDPDLALSPDGPYLLRHQVAHLLQFGLTLEESPWWYEAHAVWAEDPAGVRADRRAEAVAAYLAVSSEGLEPDDVAAWAGAFLWPHYLAAGMPAEILGAAWKEMAAVPGNNTLAAFDATASRLRGTGLADEVRAFRIWNIFLGDFDDGNHYPFGAALPSPIRHHVRSYPASMPGLGPLAALGGETVHLLANPAPGGWNLYFAGEAGAEWDLSIVTVPARLDAGPRLAEIPLEDAHGIAAIPWRELAAVVLVVQNLGGDAREPLHYALSARYDPLIPFDLMSFIAEPEAGGVALRWSTERETDLAGWRIYKSRSPVAGFTPVNGLLIPAAGGSGAASYLFLDADVRPGRKYYYLLEGVTHHGFSEITHPSAVRLPAKPGDAR